MPEQIEITLARDWDWEFEVRRTLAAPHELTTVLEPVNSCHSAQLMAIEGLTRSPRVGSKELFARASALGLDVTLELCTLNRLLQRFAAEETEVRLSVNVSPSIVGSTAVQDLFAPWCDRLIIEISEENIVRDPRVLAEAVAPLRAEGAEIALDNAGVGYGGLSMLVALEPEWVKIDRRLVGTTLTSGTSRSIVRNLSTMTHRIGSRVIGVGVEEEAQLEFLIDSDVDCWQGYLEQPFAIHRRAGAIATTLREHPIPPTASFVIQLADSASLAVGQWIRRGVTSLDDVARVTDGCYEVGWVKFRDLVGVARSN
ncbi:EAL domain-containing protein [Ferrimicrobium acidiphilum]|uniref:EAL domain-containing protein n=1 Tax=Ferrimicrobium acidiphilum TaxID=121039 RepID=UPI0023F21F3A|nr:EAL domain-containing protein [Ferrimicrobium acidiphilum]